MTKSHAPKTAKTTVSPDKLGKTGKKTGIELTEGELGQVSGGLKWKLSDVIIAG